MMMSEFIERTGFEPTASEYREIEAEYMGADVDKDTFCKEWKKNGGIQRMMRLRARRIEELEHQLHMTEKEFDSRYDSLYEKYTTEKKVLADRNKELEQENYDLRKELAKMMGMKMDSEAKLRQIKGVFDMLRDEVV